MARRVPSSPRLPFAVGVLVGVLACSGLAALALVRREGSGWRHERFAGVLPLRGAFRVKPSMVRAVVPRRPALAPAMIIEPTVNEIPALGGEAPAGKANRAPPPEEASVWPPVVQGMDLALDALRNNYDFEDYLKLKPLGMIKHAVDGDLTAIAGVPLFVKLQDFYRTTGPVYKLTFAGFKTFLVVSDPAMAKHILRDQSKDYDKGMLAYILKDIMGDGLIPASPEIAKRRRRAIAPGFHRAWLDAMTKKVVDCNAPLLDKLHAASGSGEVLKMETEFSSVTLDIIGKAVFNFDFGSVAEESPVVKAVYRALLEVEHRSTSVVPYWELPHASKFMANLAVFEQDMKLLNEVLTELIEQAYETQNQEDEEALLTRDYKNMENPSLLRFLVDARGEEVSSKQLRDDLMTLLIAGHETTSAALTWTVYELSKQPALYAEVRAEIDEVLQGRSPAFEDIGKMRLLRLCLAETLRMYPQPPLLLRRNLVDTALPAGGAGRETPIPKGTDIIISTYNLHRSPEFWENPEVYDPRRFLRPFRNPEHEYWAGFKPLLWDAMEKIHPNEQDADFAYMPFGGGERRCIGDQFAIMEAVTILSQVLQRFDLTLASEAKDVKMRTGATIHTENDLLMNVRRREAAPQ